ncbi:MAG: hypothetical protein R3260_03460 [Pseudomonas sp.]|nr:hypothetical protein [Pseudomonas sp.]
MQSREKGDYFDSFVTIRDLITLQLLTFTGQQAQDNYVGWDVLFTPTQTVVSAGVTAAPSREAATGMLRFDPSSLEAIFLNIHMPHTWIEGTYLVPYVVWQKTTSATGNVQWKLQHKSLQLDTTMPASWTTVGTVSTVGDGTTDTDTADKTLVSSFGQWDVDGFGMRDGFLLEVSRDAANANDTYAADARLVGFGLRYRTDSYGSAEQLEKVRGYL